MKDHTSRRTFLRNLSFATSGLLLRDRILSRNPVSSFDSLGYVLPKRKLGKTGVEVTMLGVGGYHIGWTTEKEAEEVIEAAIDGGVRFFDTAHGYGGGESERRYGKYLNPKYRDDIFLMTKSTAKNYDTARSELEESLRRLKTDQVDLWQLHSLTSPDDTDGRIKNGVLRFAEEALKEGKTKYVGFTGHSSPYAHLRMLEQAGDSGLFSTLQMPINVVDAASEHSFVEKVIPKSMDYEIGLLAMKTLAAGRFFKSTEIQDEVIWESESPVVPKHVSLQDAIYFSWSMPVSVLITGAENVTLLNEKIEMAKNFSKLSEDRRVGIVDKLTEIAEAGEVEYYKGRPF
jgi:aryl-alcohol dehydrogenase-like predicted oxidoreductase